MTEHHTATWMAYDTVVFEFPMSGSPFWIRILSVVLCPMFMRDWGSVNVSIMHSPILWIFNLIPCGCFTLGFCFLLYITSCYCGEAHKRTYVRTYTSASVHSVQRCVIPSLLFLGDRDDCHLVANSLPAAPSSACLLPVSRQALFYPLILSHKT